jgi:hypothetical protein
VEATPSTELPPPPPPPAETVPQTSPPVPVEANAVATTP